MQLSDISIQIASWLAVALLSAIGYLAKDMRGSMRDMIKRFETLQQEFQIVRERVIKLEVRDEISANNKT